MKRNSSVLFRQLFLLACRILGDTATPLLSKIVRRALASQAQVLVDLLKQVKPLCSERPEDIAFFVRLGDMLWR
jgi:hypothetical protein